jgi:D-alanyl-D-alanine carboxypeptidase
MITGSRGCSGRNAHRAVWALLLMAAGVFALSAAPAEAARRHRSHAMAPMPASLTDPDKDAALVVDGISGKVLYARNADVERHPASLTKMMTVYLLFEALKNNRISMNDDMRFTSHSARQKPTNLHVTAGETIKVETAINALVVRSANDVAVAVAETLGGSESHFAELMNAKARALGMRNTFYRNASGLPDPMQVTTADDLAILARHLAYDFPQYFHYFSSREFVYRGTRYEGHDNLLGRYDGTDGMKTGYTAASGFNLVSSVTRGNTHIIGVVMGGRTAQRRDKEMMRLLDDTFDALSRAPMMVAHAQLPWRMGQNGALTASLTGQTPLPAVRVASDNDTDDEDSAESRPDTDFAAAPQPAPARPAPPPQVMVASLRPPLSVFPSPKPAMRAGVAAGTGPDTASIGIHDWTIQIGAFANLDIAKRQLAAYAEKSLDILGQAQRIVVPFQSVDGQWLYRARFGPFVEREARQICARLTDRGQTCFAAISTR